jgi:hypothetical protein
MDEKESTLPPNFAPAGLEPIGPVTKAWRELLADLQITNMEFVKLIMRFCKLYSENVFRDREALTRTFLSSNMTVNDFAAGLQILAVRYLQEPLPLVMPQVSAPATAPLNLLIAAATRIFMDDVPVAIENRKDGRLVFVTEAYRGRFACRTVDPVEFDPNQVLCYDDGLAAGKDITGKLHRLSFEYGEALSPERVKQVSAQLARAVDGD